MMTRQDIKHIFLFTVIFAALSLALSLFYSRVVMHSSILSRIDRQFKSGPKDIRYLVMGDSHGQYSLDPDVLPESFNFSTAGGNYVQTYYKLKDILANGDKIINTLILPLDTHSFSTSNFAQPPESWYWIHYMDYAEVGRQRRNLAYYLFEACRGALFAYAGQRDAFLHWGEHEGPEREIRQGFIPSDERLPAGEALATAAEERAAFHFRDRELFDATLMEYFRKTLELCKAHNIKVVLVRFPVSRAYYDVADKYVDMRQVDHIVLRVRERYPDVALLDGLRMYFGKTEFFKDSDHLNADGARQFTQYVKARLPGL